MRMRKKKWVSAFLKEENKYLINHLNNFITTKPIYLEIGMGMGDFICESAKLNPNIMYVGLEKNETCVARAIKKAEENEINNLKIIHNDANNIETLIRQKSICGIFLHFPDPWPKKKQHKRRLTYNTFLKKYESILNDDGFIIFKTDNESFFDDSLLYFEASQFKLIDNSRNYFKDGEPMTGYQRRYFEEGEPIFYAKYVFK